MPGKGRSQLSIQLSNVRQAIKRGCTSGDNPREYTNAEREAFKQRRDALLEQQEEEQEARRVARINSHTTVEVDRGIQATKEAVQEGSRHSEAFFQAVGGAGSSNDMLIQGQAMIARGKQLKATEKAASVAAAKTTKDAEKLAEKQLKQEEKMAAAATKAAEKGLAATLKAETKAKRACEKAAAKTEAKRQRTLSEAFSSEQVAPPQTVVAAPLEAETENEGAQAEADKRNTEQMADSEMEVVTVCSEEPEATEQMVAMVEEMVSTPNKTEDKNVEQTAAILKEQTAAILKEQTTAILKEDTAPLRGNQTATILDEDKKEGKEVAEEDKESHEKKEWLKLTEKTPFSEELDAMLAGWKKPEPRAETEEEKISVTYRWT